MKLNNMIKKYPIHYAKVSKNSVKYLRENYKLGQKTYKIVKENQKLPIYNIGFNYKNIRRI